VLRNILLGLKDWVLESSTIWGMIPSAAVTAITQSRQLGKEIKPQYRFLKMPGYYPLPRINKLRSVPAKVEFHEARRAGPHLDFRILIDGHVHDFAIVQTDKFPTETGKVQRVQRTPTHSIKYFYTDKAVFGPGEYGEGHMKTVWRGNLDIIHSSPKKIEFSIPDGQFKGRYFMRSLSKGWILGRMKTPTSPFKERMEYTATDKKIKLAYENANTIAEHKIDGANYRVIPGEKENLVISRRLSVTGNQINQADKIPQLKYYKFPKELWGKNLHVEIVAHNGSSSLTAGLLNSGSDNSRATQSILQAPLTAVLWDIEMPSDVPYGERRRAYTKLSLSSPRVDYRLLGSKSHRFWIKRFFAPRLFQVAQSNVKTGETPQMFAERIKSEGKEGVVLKDVTKGYYEDCWVKDKKVETGDFKIVAFNEGTGKHRGRLGALVVEDPKTRIRSRVGTGFTDYERDWYWGHQEDVEGNLVLVDAHETTHHGVLRGPRYIALHPEAGITIQDEQGLRDYAKGAGTSPYAVKSAAGWRGKRG